MTRVPLVLDQGVPRGAAGLLRELGYDCIHVGETGMARAGDHEILAWSLQRSAVVVTLDADFHNILAVSEASGPSVIRIRLQGLDARGMAALIVHVLGIHIRDLERGSLITVKTHKITCHRLPVGRFE